MTAPTVAVAAATGNDSGLDFTITPGADFAQVASYTVEVYEDAATGITTDVPVATATKTGTPADGTTGIKVNVPLNPATSANYDGVTSNYKYIVTANATAAATKGAVSTGIDAVSATPTKITLETLTNTLLTVTPGPTSITLATKGAYATLPTGTEMKHSVVADNGGEDVYTKYTAPITALAGGGALTMSTDYDVYAKVVAITAPTDYSKFYTDGTAAKFDTATTAGTEPTVEGTAAGISKTYSTAVALSGNYSDAATAVVAAAGVTIKGSTGNNITAQGDWSYTADNAIVAGVNTVTNGLTWTPKNGGLIDGVTYAAKTVDFVATAKKQLVVSDFELGGTKNKTYDGTTNVPVAMTFALKAGSQVGGNTLVGLIQTLAYASKDVGNNKDITVSNVSFTASNYYLAPVNGTLTGQTGTNITVADLTITPNIAVSGTTSDVLEASDFITNATGLGTGDTIANLFNQAFTGNVSSGVATAGGVTVKFYTDNTYATVDTAVNNMPNAAGTYYYTVEVTSDTASTPNANYTLKQVVAAQGELTLTAPATGGGVSSYTVTYDVGEHGKLAEGAKKTESVSYKKSPSKVPEVIANEGYKFLGWSLDGKTVVEPTEQKITKRTTFTALYEETEKALAFDKVFRTPYIKGIEENGNLVFKPEAPMTRGEVAAMLSRTLTIKMDETKDYATGKFPDLKGDEWYAQSIGFLAELGVMKGMEDGTCGAEKYITRAEFVALVMRVDGLVAGDNKFPDVAADHWALEYIVAATAKGYIRGDDYGNFLPGADITRASVVKIMNGVLGWSWATQGEMLFTDVADDHWAYNDIVKASTGK